MLAGPVAAQPPLVRRARALAWAGIAWHGVEFAVAVAAGLAAGSIALVGFGADSLIEALAGGVVLWRFGERRAAAGDVERRAQRLIAASFVLLAVFIAVESVHSLLGGRHPEPSPVGIGLALVTAAAMPVMAAAKRRVARGLGSAAAVRESTQNVLCAWLSVALLAGLGLNAALGWWWADPLAALAIAGVALREGILGWRGDPCCDGCA